MNGKPEAVQLDDSYHEVETESDARRVTHLVGTIEAPQYGLALLLADAGAGIGHAHDGPAIIAQQAHIDPASVGRKLDRVVDQVGDRLDQQILVATHIEILVDVNPQGDILVLGDRFINVADFPQHFMQRDAAETYRATAVFDLGEAPQGRDDRQRLI